MPRTPGGSVPRWCGPPERPPTWPWPRRGEVMPRPSDPFPDLADLTARLAAVLDGRSSVRGGLTILDRKPSPYTSTFPSEIVTCRTDGGATLRVFCKHAAGRSHHAHGHRGGIAYE